MELMRLSLIDGNFVPRREQPDFGGSLVPLSGITPPLRLCGWAPDESHVRQDMRSELGKERVEGGSRVAVNVERLMFCALVS